MSVVFRSKTNLIHKADAREVAKRERPGSFALAIVDGPYAMRKAGWDRMGVEELPGWYAPHLDDVDRLCAPSATLYVWGSDESEPMLRPSLRARGWRFRVSIVWDKGVPANAMGWSTVGGWAQATERCGVWTRGDARIRPSGPITNVWRMGHKAYQNERLRTGRLVPPKSILNGEAAGYVCGPVREALHPCQKPLLFADRILRASTRPGERVWVPFGGTCREAVAAEWMARAEPDEARQVVTCEIDQDGRDYLDAVVRQLRGEDVRKRDPRQASLFGEAA